MAKNRENTTKSAEDIGAEVIAEMDREFHESSDRVIAIVGAAYLDSMLERLLRQVFIEAPDEVERLLRPDSPLGSNGSRYEIAYCLGLITRDQRHDLKVIAKIRNTFAHDFKANSFDVPPVRDFCASLRQPAVLAAMPTQLVSATTAETMAKYVCDITATPREKYRMSIIMLFGSLLRRIKYVRRADPNSWFSYNPDSLVGPQSHEPSGG